MVCSSSITASAIQMVIQELVLKKNCHCQQKQFCFLVCSKLLGLEKYLFLSKYKNCSIWKPSYSRACCKYTKLTVNILFFSLQTLLLKNRNKTILLRPHLWILSASSHLFGAFKCLKKIWLVLHSTVQQYMTPSHAHDDKLTQFCA